MKNRTGGTMSLYCPIDGKLLRVEYTPDGGEKCWYHVDTDDGLAFHSWLPGYISLHREEFSKFAGEMESSRLEERLNEFSAREKAETELYPRRTVKLLEDDPEIARREYEGWFPGSTGNPTLQGSQ